MLGGKSPKGGRISISLVPQSRPILASSKDGDGPINESVYEPLVISPTKGRWSVRNSNRPVKHFKRNTAHITPEVSNLIHSQNIENSPFGKSDSDLGVDGEEPLAREQIQVLGSVVRTQPSPKPFPEGHQEVSINKDYNKLANKVRIKSRDPSLREMPDKAGFLQKIQTITKDKIDLQKYADKFQIRKPQAGAANGKPFQIQESLLKTFDDRCPTNALTTTTTPGKSRGWGTIADSITEKKNPKLNVTMDPQGTSNPKTPDPKKKFLIQTPSLNPDSKFTMKRKSITAKGLTPQGNSKVATDLFKGNQIFNTQNLNSSIDKKRGAALGNSIVVGPQTTKNVPVNPREDNSGDMSPTAWMGKWMREEARDTMANIGGMSLGRGGRNGSK